MFPWSQECLVGEEKRISSQSGEEIVVYNLEENNTKGFFDSYNVTYHEVFNVTKDPIKKFFEIQKAEKTCYCGLKNSTPPQ